MAKRRKRRVVDSKQGDFLDGDGFSRPREAMARAGDPVTSKEAPVEEAVEEQRRIALETYDRHDRPEGMHSDEGLEFAVEDHPGINLEFFHKRQSEIWKDFVNPLIYPVHNKYGEPIKRPTKYGRDAMVFRITPEGREALAHLKKTGEWPKRDPERDRKKSNRKKSNNGEASGVEVDLEV